MPFTAWQVAYTGPPACSLPVLPYPALRCSPSRRDDAVCPVCTEALAVGDEVQLLPCHAKHTFHVACLAPWLAQSNACPVCRQVGGGVEGRRGRKGVTSERQSCAGKSGGRSYGGGGGRGRGRGQGTPVATGGRMVVDGRPTGVAMRQELATRSDGQRSYGLTTAGEHGRFGAWQL